MGRHLHLDPFGGIAGEQWLGLLLDLRTSQATLEAAAQAVGVHARLEVSETEIAGIKASRVELVTADKEPREFGSVRAQVEAASLPDRARDRALATLARMAGASAALDGVRSDSAPIPDAVATVATIAGACALLEDLDVESLSCGPIATGSGFIRDSEAMVPIPTSLSLRLLVDFEVYAGEEKSDLVPPAGAALVAGLCRPARIHPGMVLDRYGHGAGSGESVRAPHVLRGYIGEPLQPLIQLEATPDDPPEQVAYALERLHQVGAVEAWVEPTSKTRGRLGSRIVVLGERKDEADLRTVLLRETSAVVVRTMVVELTQALHRVQRVSTAFGEVPVRRKADWLSPDYETCATLAREHGVPIHRVVDAAKVAARKADPRGGSAAPVAGSSSPPPTSLDD